MAISKFPKSLSIVDRASALEAGDDLDVSGEVQTGESDRDLFERGEIDREEFIEREVSRALSHLEGAVVSTELEAMKRLLAVEMRESPVFSDLLDKLARRAS